MKKKMTYIARDAFDREVFRTEDGLLLVDVEMDYTFHQGRKLCTVCRNEFGGEPDCPAGDAGEYEVTNEAYRRECNENPYKKTYLLLSRMESECRYHIGWARKMRTKPISDPGEHMARMRELWNSLPGDAKPEWLTAGDLDRLEAMMASDSIFLPDENNILKEIK